MAASADLKVRCPACGAKYRLPTHAIGRKARCAKCETLFVVVRPTPTPADSKSGTDSTPTADPKRPTTTPASTQARNTSPPQTGSASTATATLKPRPTDEDILRWLTEAESDADRERRVERSEDGVDAFDMPTDSDMPTDAAPRPTSHAAPPFAGDTLATAAPRLRLAPDDPADSAAGVSTPIRRVV